MKKTALALLVTALLFGALGAAPLAVQAGTDARPTDKPAVGAQRVEPGSVPKGFSSVEWGGIQSQIAAKRYRAYAVPGGYASANPAHGWQIHYGIDGATALSPRASLSNNARGRDRAEQAPDWRWELVVTGYGYGNPVQLQSPEAVHADAQRLTYAWDQNMREWWINGVAGLEQGFTLNARPDGARAGQPLRVTLAIQGDLRPTQRGTGIAFEDRTGATAFTYDALRAWDASGQAVPARMVLAGRTLALEVDDAGARYPLTIDPSVQQAYLKASNTGAGDEFGGAVAISGDTAVVGAQFEDSAATGVDGNGNSNSADASGAVYVFVRSGSVWSQEAYLKASNAEAGDRFGGSVAISGDTVVVGAQDESSNATGVNGDQADNSAPSSGAAYVFVRDAGVWSQQAYLKASNAEEADTFGGSVAISDDTVVVGAANEASNATGVDGDQNDNSSLSSGAAYVFVRSGNAWSQQAYLKASNPGSDDLFGTSVSISGNTVVVGAPNEDSNATGVNGNQNDDTAVNAGAAYVFVRNGAAWSQQAYLKASNTQSLDAFGNSASVSGDTLVIGATGEDSNATGVNGSQIDNSDSASGAAYVFMRSTGVWSQQAYLKASNTESQDAFGSSIAISGDRILVGADGEDSSATGVNGNQSDNLAPSSGAAYLFVRSGNAWSQQDYLKASNPDSGDEYGRSVAVSIDGVVIGARGEAGNATGVNGNQIDDSAVNAGAAYVFSPPLALSTHYTGTGSGAITLNPPGGVYTYGDIVTATAVITVGSVFSGWSGDASGAVNPITLTMDSDKSITATFGINSPPVSAAGPDQRVAVGAGVTLSGTGSTDPDGHTPLTYRWVQTGGTAVTLSNASAVTPTFTAPNTPSVLTFTLAVTDALGVADASPDTVVITAADIPISGFAAQSSSPTRLTDITYFTATIGAGTNVSPGSYLWDFGDGNPMGPGPAQSHIYQAAGSYTATVTAGNSEGFVTATIKVTITNSAPVASAGPDQAKFVGDLVTLNGSGSVDSDNHTPLSYHWAQTGGTAVTLSGAASASPSFTAPSAPGVLTFTLSVTDSQGLADASPDTVVITVSDVGIAGLAASNSSPTRLTDPTVFTATAAAGSNVVYTWNFGDGSPTSIGATRSHTYSAVGAYTAIVTATNGAGSATATTPVTIINSAPVANAGPDQTVTLSVNVTLSGAGSADPDNHTPLSYGWAQTGGPAVTLGAATSATTTFTAPGSPTVLTFTLRVTDAQGLADSTPDTVVITVTDTGISGLAAANSSPTRLTNASQFTATIAAGSNVTYSWVFGDGSPAGTGATTSHTYATAGAFTATVTARNGSSTASATTAVAVTNSPPLANAGPDQSVSVSAAVTLNGAGSSDPDGHTPLTYRWTRTGGPAVTLSNPAVASPTFSAPATPAVLTFTLAVTDAQGLADATPDTVVITVRDVAISGLAAHSSSPTRLTGATAFTATVAAASNATYVWSFGDGTSSGSSAAASTTHTYSRAGSYTAIVTATNGSGSASASTVVVVTNLAPVADAGPDASVDVGANVALNGSASADPDGHTPLVFRWTQTGGPAVALINSNLAAPTFFAPVTPAVLTFTLAVTDAQGLSAVASDQVVITVKDIGVTFLAVGSSSPTRLTDPTYFTATTATGSNLIYTWDFGDGVVVSSGPDSTVTHTYAAAGNYTARVQASNSSSGAVAVTAVSITNLPPVADAGHNQTVSIDGGVTLAAIGSADPDGHTPLSYGWVQTGGPSVTLNNPSVATPMFTAPAIPAVLTFTLMVTDAAGMPAAATDTVVITVLDIGISGLSATNSSPTRLTDVTTFTATQGVGSNLLYTWDFGDGSSAPPSADSHAMHTYAAVGRYVAVVTVTNGLGSVGASTVAAVTNLPPLANAGPDQSVSGGASVTLDGTASIDPDGHTPLNYGWVQTGGPAVQLSDPAAAAPSFEAPVVSTVLTFSLRVTDSAGLAGAASDEVVVRVSSLPNDRMTGALSQVYGDLITYTLVVSNGHPSVPLLNVVISGSVPAGALLVATDADSTLPGGDYGNDFVRKGPLTLMTGRQIVLNWTVRPMSLGGDIATQGHAIASNATNRLDLGIRVKRIFAPLVFRR